MRRTRAVVCLDKIPKGKVGRMGSFSLSTPLFLCLYVNVVYLSIPTSNHNYWWENVDGVEVVYLSIPTSNHNVIVNLS